MSKDLTKLEEKLGITFENKDNLRQALVHRSYLNEHPDFELDHNERLEFLGDAVLELVTTEFLFQEYPKETEGVMTNWRAALVRTEMLAEISTSMEVNDFLYLSHGETKDTGKARDVILANAMEAIIGGCYLDQGYEAAQKFITDNILVKLPSILNNKTYLDPKSKLQEKVQELFGVTPHYSVIKESGPDHKKQFIVAVMMEEYELGRGEGTSKQEAQVESAKFALNQKTYEKIKVTKE